VFNEQTVSNFLFFPNLSFSVSFQLFTSLVVFLYLCTPSCSGSSHKPLSFKF
jgi:hypothetical protein